MPLTVGGGIRTIEDIRRVLQAGADKVSINSAAVKDPDFVRRAAERFGSQCIVVAIDPKRMRSGKMAAAVMVCGLACTSTAGGFRRGWRRWTGPGEVEELGAGEIVLTCMDADGTQDGYDIPMTRAVAEAVSIPVVASGGAGRRSNGPRGTEGKADRPWRPASSTGGGIPSPRPRRRWPRRRSGAAARKKSKVLSPKSFGGKTWTLDFRLWTYRDLGLQDSEDMDETDDRPTMDHLLRLAHGREASDLHLKAGQPPVLRIGGDIQLYGLGGGSAPRRCVDLAYEIMNELRAAGSSRRSERPISRT